MKPKLAVSEKITRIYYVNSEEMRDVLGLPADERIVSLSEFSRTVCGSIRWSITTEEQV